MKTNNALAAFLAVCLAPVLTSCAHVSAVRDATGKPIACEIATMEQIELNGTRQWIYVTGRDADNPVLLWLDGGPGGSEVAWVREYLGPLHESFTVVCWDQRGTGKSYGAVRDSAELTPQKYVDDVIELSSILARRFGKPNVYLVGHSWGSIIGLMAASARPELFAAYIGVGQQINGPENDRIGWYMVRNGALEEGDAKVARRLEENGLPPYDDGERYMYLLSRLYHFSPRAPAQGRFDSMIMFSANEHTPIDSVNVYRGLYRGVMDVYPKVGELDFERDVTRVGCPLFIVAGRYDMTCVSTLAERWFLRVDAPMKEFVWFEESGHTACYTENDKFTEFMTGTVLARTVGAR
jgi:pimeloyl-ACP methyl ester carboxylesterase